MAAQRFYIDSSAYLCILLGESGSERIGQTVQVLEGYSAFIRVGEARPVRNRQVVRTMVNGQLVDRVVDALREVGLELGGRHRDAVEEQHQVDDVVVGGLDLPHHPQAVLRGIDEKVGSSRRQAFHPRGQLLGFAFQLFCRHVLWLLISNLRPGPGAGNHPARHINFYHSSC